MNASLITFPKLKAPWLVAVWPGMGHVAINAGYYLMAKLGMHQIAEFAPRDLFDLDHVDVAKGLIQPGKLPRSRFYVGSDPDWKHDIVLFIGEAQPANGKYIFCCQLLEFAKSLGVERVFTFASMSTQMHPEHESRIFTAATNPHSVTELQEHNLELLEDGRIGGLNGVLLGVAAENNLPGICLLGEIPHIFSQLPFPKAAVAVLEAFTTLAGMTIDLHELRQQSQIVEARLGELLSQVEASLKQQSGDDESVEESFIPLEEEQLSSSDRRHVEQLFEQTQNDRSKAFLLKQELDRLGVFAEYEDRFLDLFKPGEST